MLAFVQIVGGAIAVVIELIVRLMMILIRVDISRVNGSSANTTAANHIRLRWRIGLREFVIGDLLTGLDVARELVHAAVARVDIGANAAANQQWLGLLNGLDAHRHWSVAFDDDGPLLDGHRSVDEHWSRHVDDLRSHDDALAWHEYRSDYGHVDVARYVDGLLLRLLVRFRHQEDWLDRLFARVKFQVTQFVPLFGLYILFKSSYSTKSYFSSNFLLNFKSSMFSLKFNFHLLNCFYDVVFEFL